LISIQRTDMSAVVVTFLTAFSSPEVKLMSILCVQYDFEAVIEQH